MSFLQAITSSHWLASDSSDPVVLMLHGYGADEHDLVSLSSALPAHIPWASVRAPLQMPFGGAAWFELSDVNRPDPQEVAAATSALWRWIEAKVPAHRPIIPLGFSQGGMVAIELLRTRPQRIPALAFLSSYVVPSSRIAPPEPFHPRPKVFWGRGSQDPLFTEETITATEKWLHAHTDVMQRIYPDLGHGISAEETQDLQQFFAVTIPHVSPSR